jgi:hypothetical protein
MLQVKKQGDHNHPDPGYVILATVHEGSGEGLRATT